MKLKTKFNTAHDSLGFLLWKASNKLQRLHRSCLSDLDLTPTQFSVLASIVYNCNDKQTTTQQELVNQTQMDKMLVSDVVKALTVKKMILKSKNPNDSRSFVLKPTLSGSEKVNIAIKRVEEIDEIFFKTIKSKNNFLLNLQELVD